MAVSSLNFTSAQPTSITFSYSLEGYYPDGYYYTLYRNTTTNFATATLVSGFGTKTNTTSTNQTGSYTDTGLSPLTSYYYWLQGRDGASGLVRSGYPLRFGTFTTSGYPAPVWTDNTLSSSFQVGTAYSDAVTASNMNYSGAYSVSAGTLPPGISLDTSTGAVTGTPTSTGSYAFTLRASNSGGAITSSYSVTVIPAPVYPPTWSDSAVNNSFIINNSYSDGVTATNMNYSGVYSIVPVPGGALPAGLSLNTSTGAITGTPTTIQSYSFAITATNSYGSISTATFSGNVLGGMQVWSGSWVKGTVKVWNSSTSQWKLGTVYVYSSTLGWVVSK